MRCPFRVAKTNEQKKAECDADTTDTSHIPHEDQPDAADDAADDAQSESDDTSSSVEGHFFCWVRNLAYAARILGIEQQLFQ